MEIAHWKFIVQTDQYFELKKSDWLVQQNVYDCA